MGAGSSTEQRSPEQPEAGSGAPAEPRPQPRPQPGGPAAAAEEEEEAPGAAGDPDIAAADPATKPLQKNGQLSTLNGLAEQEELPPQEAALNGQEAEVIVPEVGQREAEDGTERDADKELAADSSAVRDAAKDGQEEMPGTLEQVPSSDSNLEELTPPAESAQTNDVGFKKVFKFVGFKFTVKKEKSEKPDPAQLLTVRKEEGEGAGEAEGAGDHQEPSREAGEATPKESELKQPTETPEGTPEPEDAPAPPERSGADAPLQAESDGHAAGEGRDGEGRQEREPDRSPDSPTSPGASDTASPFRKFFAQGWAGWRKKASFRKAREEEPGAAERKTEPGPDGGDAGGQEKADDAPGKPAAAAERPQAPEAEAEQLEPPPDGPCAPLATEVFDEKVEVVAEVHVSTEVHASAERAEEPGAGAGGPEAPPPAEQLADTDAAAAAAAEPPGCAPAGDPAPPPEAAPPEGIAGEADRLAAQERARAQGSPLKKLFSSTGLKKLSGRRQRAKEPGDQPAAAAPADSPDSPDEPRAESSASSPEEPEEPAGPERGAAEAPPAKEANAAEEGAASDGEKRREGVTPWASFKKMVTPKKRARRPSESDREEEPEKAKSATLSSAESAASEAPGEGRGPGDEPKPPPPPPPEEPRRKADASVSWEALICVGSSKKRARKASSSSSSSDGDDEEEAAPKPAAAGEGPRPEGAGQDRDADAGPDAGPRERAPGQGSPSPEQAGSPSEGEGGVSTWESFKRLVTPRKKPKCKAEERPDDDAAAERPAAEAEPGREEAWVSIRKLIPGRRKKRPEGRPDPAAAAAAGGAGPAEAHEEDADVPAVVPLAEFDAAEREKREAQGAAPEGAVSVPEEPGRGLVHTVTTVAAVDGARAATDVEERSPSWISAAAAARPPDRAPEEARPPPAAGASERGVTPAPPESRDAGEDEDTGAGGGVALTAQAAAAAEPPEAAEAPGAEEAASPPSESPDTTEEATPVQEAEGGEPDVEGQERRTREVLRAVAERVGEASQLAVRGPGATRRVEARLPGVAEAEEEAPGGEAGAAVQGHAAETETEALPQGAAPGQAAALEHAGGEPQVPAESVAAAEPLTPCHAETLAGAKPELVLEQAVGPDSAETLADSEAGASTPVACATQQDTATGVHAEGAGAEPQGGEAQAVPAPRETPPAPSGFHSQEEKKEHAGTEGGPERADEEVPVETVPVLAKAEVTRGAGQFADEEPKDAPFVEGPDESADTDITASQTKTVEAALRDEVTEEADGQRSEETELQSPAQAPAAPGETETAGPAGREETEAAAAHAREEEREPTPGGVPGSQLAQTVHVAVVDGEREVTRLEESSACLVQGQTLCTDGQVQSPEAALPLAAVAMEEQVLGETVQLFEAARPWASAEARGEPAAEPCGGEGAGAGPGAEKITSQGGKSEEDREQVSGQGVGVSETGEAGFKGEEEISQLKTESQKLVQNVIRTAVGQLVSTEDTAAGGQPPAPPAEAGQQEAEQRIEKEEGEPRGPAEAEAAPGQSALTAGGQGPSDVPKGARAAAEEAADAGVPGSRVDGQQRGELPVPAQDKREATGTRSEPEFGDHAHGLGERTENEPQEKERRDAAADYPENQISALVDPEASGDLTKECPDANGPKLKEKEAGLQAEKGQSGPDKEIKTQTPEEAQEQERQPSAPELAES